MKTKTTEGAFSAFTTAALSAMIAEGLSLKGQLLSIGKALPLVEKTTTRNLRSKLATRRILVDEVEIIGRRDLSDKQKLVLDRFDAALSFLKVIDPIAAQKTLASLSAMASKARAKPAKVSQPPAKVSQPPRGDTAPIAPIAKLA